MKKIIITSALCAVSLGVYAADDARVVASTPRGGVVRFTGNVIGGAILAAQSHCVKQVMHAVPLGFFPSGSEQLMTFECVK